MTSTPYERMRAVDRGTADDCAELSDGRPQGLSELGNAAYDEAMELIQEHGLDPCGCKTFYSPHEWRARGERYGCESHLIIVYDGGNINHIAQISGKYNEEFIVALSNHGLFVEEATGWYACVYTA